jgi:hypothetical protein
MESVMEHDQRPLSPEDHELIKRAELSHNFKNFLIIRGVERVKCKYTFLIELFNRLSFDKDDENNVIGAVYINEPNQSAESLTVILIVKKLRLITRKIQRKGVSISPHQFELRVAQKKLSIKLANPFTEKIKLYDLRRVDKELSLGFLDYALTNGRNWTLITALKFMREKASCVNESLKALFCTHRRVFITVSIEESILRLRHNLLVKYGTDYGLDPSFSTAAFMMDQ